MKITHVEQLFLFLQVIVFIDLFVYILYHVFNLETKLEVFSFWFWIHIASTPSTAGTHTDGGAVIRKPGSAWLEGTPAISIIFKFGFEIIVLK